MRRRAGLALLLLAAPPLAGAAGFDARGLARFDTGYARCEARFEAMKGARDEAYLAVYRVKADAAGRARLAELRRGAAYRKELRAAQAEAAKSVASAASAASAASSPLEHQCQALWAQVQRARGTAGKP
ncbi:hypothetical protein [Piscinibacter sp.]|uniref:hypothetical protein n=1 Tax=Piscinibacter sp. TaxID=1903157 RepID=UPI0039E67200